MVGLGLGYLAGGQLADRAGKNRPILYFVLAELGIGLFDLVSKSIIYDWLCLSNAFAGRWCFLGLAYSFFDIAVSYFSDETFVASVIEGI